MIGQVLYHLLQKITFRRVCVFMSLCLLRVPGKWTVENLLERAFGENISSDFESWKSMTRAASRRKEPWTWHIFVIVVLFVCEYLRNEVNLHPYFPSITLLLFACLKYSPCCPKRRAGLQPNVILSFFKGFSTRFFWSITFSNGWKLCKNERSRIETR